MITMFTMRESLFEKFGSFIGLILFSIWVLVSCCLVLTGMVALQAILGMPEWAALCFMLVFTFLVQPLALLLGVIGLFFIDWTMPMVKLQSMINALVPGTF